MQADARTHCQEHIVQRDERVSFPLSLCSQPLPCLKPKVKKKEGGTKKNPPPQRRSSPVYEVLSQLQNQAMEVAIAPQKDRKNRTRVHNSS